MPEPANAVTSRTKAVVNNAIIYEMGPVNREGLFCYIKYDKGNGTSMSVKLTSLTSLDPADEYQHIYLDASMKPQPMAFEFSASGNYRIPIPAGQSEKQVKATVSFVGGDTQAVVIDFQD